MTTSNGTPTASAVVRAALTPELKVKANADVELYKSSHESRRALVQALRAADYTSASFPKPAEGECDKFYTQMMAISAKACGERVSDKGLTPEEKADLPNGVYTVSVLTSPDVKPSALPPWATEPNRIGKLSIYRYFNQQKGQWYRSVAKSMAKMEAQIALVSGGAKERTASVAERTIGDLVKLIGRERKSETPSVNTNEINYLIKMVHRISSDNDIANPLDTDSE